MSSSPRFCPSVHSKADAENARRRTSASPERAKAERMQISHNARGQSFFHVGSVNTDWRGGNYSYLSNADPLMEGLSAPPI